MANSAVGIAIAGTLVALAAISVMLPGPSQEEIAATNAQMDLKATIDYCWRDQAKKSYDSSTAQFVAGICEAAERKYFNEYGRWYRRNGL